MDAMTNPTATVLFVGHCEPDHDALADIFSGRHWQLHHARTPDEAWRLIHSRPFDVVLADALGDWRSLLGEVLEMQSPPPFIVTASTRDDSLWAEVLDNGGFDVLLKPFNSTEVFRTLNFAWRQYRDRLHLSSTRSLAAIA